MNMIPWLTAVWLAAGSSFSANPAPAGPRSADGQIAHEVKVTNIEVPVRVFKGEAFVDSLGKDDFEVFEDGVPQKLDAVYLIKKTIVARNEGGDAAAPRTGRLYVLLFEMSDYQPEITRAMDYFFDKVIEAQDELILMTPMKTYHLKPGMIAKTSRAKVKDDLIAKVRRDVIIGGTEYRGLLRELENMTSADEQSLLLYGETLKRLETLRYVDERKLLDFARFLKNREGQKHVFFFYQKEVLPKINAKYISLLITENQERPDIIFELMDKFEYYNRDFTFDVQAVQEAFSDSSIAVHFLYLTKTFHPPGGGTNFVSFEEQSEDIFSAFSEIAKATGGLIDSSASAEQSFQRAAAATENYYLLYYRPVNTKTEKVFRKIEVRVKGGGVRLTYRQGYIAG